MAMTQQAKTQPETFPGMDATVSWVGGVGFEAQGMGGAVLRIDQPAGGGGTGHGFMPIELQLHALAACVATTVVKILEKQRVGLQSYRIEAHGTRDPELPHPYTHIVLDHIFAGPGLNRGSLERTIALVDEKYCSVSAILPRGLVKHRIQIEK